MGFSVKTSADFWFVMEDYEVPFAPNEEKKAALNMLNAAVQIALAHAEPDEVFATIEEAAWVTGQN